MGGNFLKFREQLTIRNYAEEAKAELLEKFIPTYKVSFLALALYIGLI